MGYKCIKCDDEYEEEPDIEIHVLSEFADLFEGDGGKCKCDICGEEFEHESDLGMHIMWGEGVVERTGKTLIEWNDFMRDASFDAIRAEIDDHAQGE